MEIEIIKTQDLDISKIIVPKGYKVILDPEIVKLERIQNEIYELEQYILNTPEPSLKELAEYGKLYHPYYENIKKLNELNG